MLRHQNLMTTQIYLGKVSEHEAIRWMAILHGNEKIPYKLRGVTFGLWGTLIFCHRSFPHINDLEVCLLPELLFFLSKSNVQGCT